jgi:hypothetical protein
MGIKGYTPGRLHRPGVFIHSSLREFTTQFVTVADQCFLEHASAQVYLFPLQQGTLELSHHNEPDG